MNPFSKTITFSEKKPNHFYCIKENNTYLKVDNPKKGDIVYEIPTVSGGEETKKILLEIPIPLCQKHQHGGIPFGVKTCNNWEYIAIPVPLGSLMCRECHKELFLPQPYLRSADLRSANLRSANLRRADLRCANLHSADLCRADLRRADLSYANLHSANLSYVDMSDANLHSANLSYVDMSSADLSYANLSYANLSYANLHSANLSYVDMSYVDLSCVNNINESFNLDKVSWNKFTIIAKQFKKLLNKERFLK